MVVNTFDPTLSGLTGPAPPCGDKHWTRDQEIVKRRFLKLHIFPLTHGQHESSPPSLTLSSLALVVTIARRGKSSAGAPSGTRTSSTPSDSSFSSVSIMTVIAGVCAAIVEQMHAHIGHCIQYGAHCTAQTPAITVMIEADENVEVERVEEVRAPLGALALLSPRRAIVTTGARESRVSDGGEDYHLQT